jgi:CarboxypepD_reg-like domain
LLCLVALPAMAQVRISGRVFDITRQKSLEAVSVISSSGGGTVTDVNGRYTIIVSEKDSIWFSYLGKPTPKFPVLTIQNTQNFEVALHVNITDLKQVVVMPRNYRMDSLQNRKDYAKAFNFRRPNLESMTTMNPMGGAGLDIGELIRLFQFRRNRRMEAFQERLLREETEKYIDYRFSRPLIIKLTQLRGPALDTFIRWYRPTIEFTEVASEYEFQSYIKRCYLQYERYRRLIGDGRREEE